METTNGDNQKTIYLSRNEIAELVQEKFIDKDLETVLHWTNLYNNGTFAFEFTIVKKFTPDEEAQRKQSLEVASSIQFTDVVEELKNKFPDSRRLISAATTYLPKQWTLADVISISEHELMKFRRVGAGFVSLLKEYLKEKGHRFQQWNGKEWV